MTGDFEWRVQMPGNQLTAKLNKKRLIGRYKMVGSQQISAPSCLKGVEEGEEQGQDDKALSGGRGFRGSYESDEGKNVREK